MLEGGCWRRWVCRWMSLEVSLGIIGGRHRWIFARTCMAWHAWHGTKVRDPPPTIASSYRDRRRLRRHEGEPAPVVPEQ